MKKVFILLLVIASITPYAAAQEVIFDYVNSSVNDRKVNVGIKAGFSSAIYLTSSFEVNGKSINNVQNNYKIGYNTSLFLRFNFGKHFFQPELGYYINRGEIEFSKNDGSINENLPDYSSIKSKLHSVDIPLLYGYNFIKQGIYGMSFFIGPKVKFNLAGQQKIKYRNFDVTNIQEELYPLNIGATIGISVYISKVFFDLRYDQIVHNISKSIDYSLHDDIASYGKIKLHRRDNMLSFSLGVIL